MTIEQLAKKYIEAKAMADVVREANRNVFDAEEEAKKALKEAATRELAVGTHVAYPGVVVAVREGGERIDARQCYEALGFLYDGVQTAVENMIAGNEEGLLEWLMNVAEVAKKTLAEAKKHAEPVVVIREGGRNTEKSE